MAGEGACFAHCPPGYATRPRDTGWFAGFADLEGAAGGKVAYAAGGGRLLGGTFDPTGVYRLNAVQRWLDALGVAVADIHEHVAALQARFLAAAPTPSSSRGRTSPNAATSSPSASPIPAGPPPSMPPSTPPGSWSTTATTGSASASGSTTTRPTSRSSSDTCRRSPAGHNG